MRTIDCRQKNLPSKRGTRKLKFDPPNPVDCRKRKQGHSFSKIAVLFFPIALNLLGFFAIGGTAAYYFDSELSAGNSFDAALLDFELSSPGDFTPGVSLTQEATRQIGVVDVQSVDFHYSAHAENFSGSLCELLNLRATLKGDQKYLGPLMSFAAGDFDFAEPEDWDFEAIVTTANSGELCEFDFVFSGWQIPFPVILSGFHDVERIHSTIRTQAAQCDALSIGYWKNHEGCAGGEGSSVWAAEINNLSTNYSGAFSSYSGAQICENLWTPNCPGGNTVESKLCKAKAQTLADELDVVSGRLDPAALLAGADDGDGAFDNLGLSSGSTVGEALAAIEAILADSSSTVGQLTDAAYAAERMYAFYEDENLNWPACVYDLGNGEIQSSIEEPAVESSDPTAPSDDGAEPSVETPVEDPTTIDEPPAAIEEIPAEAEPTQSNEE